MGIIISDKILSESKKLGLPVEADGINANFCKNPKCSNFGALPLAEVSFGKRTSDSMIDSYIIQNSAGGSPALRCKVCGEMPTIKSKGLS